MSAEAEAGAAAGSTVASAATTARLPEAQAATAPRPSATSAHDPGRTTRALPSTPSVSAAVPTATVPSVTVPSDGAVGDGALGERAVGRGAVRDRAVAPDAGRDARLAIDPDGHDASVARGARGDRSDGAGGDRPDDADLAFRADGAVDADGDDSVRRADAVARDAAHAECPEGAPACRRPAASVARRGGDGRWAVSGRVADTRLASPEAR